MLFDHLFEKYSCLLLYIAKCRMAGDGEGSGWSGLASSGQGHRGTRRRSLPSGQAPGQFPRQVLQQTPEHAPQEVARQAPQQTPQQSYRGTDKVSSTDRAAASTKECPQGPLTGSAGRNIDLAAGEESSTSNDKRQQSFGSRDSPSEATSRQKRQQPSAGASGAHIKPLGGDGAQPCTSSPRGPCVKTTANISYPNPLLAPRGPLVGPLTRPSQSGGTEPHNRASGCLPPPGPGAASRPSRGPSLSLKPQDRPAGSSPGPSTGLSTRMSRLEVAAKSSRDLSESAERRIRLGIHTEFFLAARNKQQHSSDVKEFVKILADNYNRQVVNKHPRARRDIEQDQSNPKDYNRKNREYKDWTFVQNWEYPDRLENSCKLFLFQMTLKVLAVLH